MIVAGSVLLAAGCGGHGSAKAEKPTVKASSTTAAAAGGKPVAMTRAQLDHAVIADGDAAGWKVTAAKAASGPVGGARMVADKAACQPVADALSETGAVKSVAAVERSAVAEDRSGIMVRVRLASYDGDGAGKIMADLAGAAQKCKGFDGSGSGGKQHVGVAQYDAYLSAQTSLGFRLTAKVGKQTLPIYLDVGSVGGTVEYLATFNVLGDDPGTGSTTAERQQSVKLGAATT
ncbi:hypothetical protein ACFV06_06135 [Streptomyces sp. NPDC059618]|uniref:hypothetical protein n=1 Tax=Streptomyces sp. NPDC059618 TaxID=3346887 RepID=UPI0036B401BC